MKLLFITILFFAFTKLLAQNTSCKPILLLSGYKWGDTIAKNDLSKLSNLTIYYPCDKTISNRIISYEFTLFKGTSSESFAGFGHRLTSKMKEQLQKAGTGSKIYVDLVKIKGPKGVSEIAGITLFVGSGARSIPFKIDSSGLMGKIPSCDPIVLAGKYKDGSKISKNELNLINNLSANSSCNTGKKYNGCNMDVSYKIISYEVSATLDGQSFFLKCTSSEFSKEIKEQFRDIKTTTKLLISNIHAKYPDGSILQIPGITLHIDPVSKPKGGDFTRSKKSSVIKK